MPDLSVRARDARGCLLPRSRDEIPATKVCTGCGRELLLDAYSFDRRKADGRMSRCRSCCASAVNAIRHADPEAARAYDRGAKRKQRRNARLAQRRRDDPGWARRVDAIREIRRQLALSGISTDELYERDGGVCHICVTHVDRADAEPDHLVPLALGGANTPENVRISHAVCNRRKADLLDWSHLAGKDLD